MQVLRSILSLETIITLLVIWEVFDLSCHFADETDTRIIEDPGDGP